jgi:PIN domain nuclease of toxin-antitoxin system
MKALLDTHTFLWWVSNDDRLPDRVRALIHDGDNELFLSVASGWEIVIKVQLGRLQLTDDPDEFLPRQLALNSITVLPITMSHALRIHALPSHHRDPFDRMLVAQSQVERLPIVTADPQIARYAVDIIW